MCEYVFAIEKKLYVIFKTFVIGPLFSNEVLDRIAIAGYRRLTDTLARAVSRRISPTLIMLYIFLSQTSSCISIKYILYTCTP